MPTLDECRHVCVCVCECVYAQSYTYSYTYVHRHLLTYCNESLLKVL